MHSNATSSSDDNNLPESDQNMTPKLMRRVLNKTIDAAQSNPQVMQDMIETIKILAQQQPEGELNTVLKKALAGGSSCIMTVHDLHWSEHIACEDATMSATLLKENISLQQHSPSIDSKAPNMNENSIRAGSHKRLHSNTQGDKHTTATE